MSDKRTQAETARHNGHATIRRQDPSAPDGELDVEPKGTPTADRYHAETAHTTETDKHGGPKKAPRDG
jgi:hypothetical protein